MKKMKLSLISLLVGASVMSVARAQDYVHYHFEKEMVPAISAKSGQLSLINYRAKDGQQALKWDFNKGDTLVFSQPIDLTGDNDVEPLTFLAWVYNEKAIDDKLTFEFLVDGKNKKNFEYGLDFTGWRGIAIPYRDMQGDKVERLDKLTITAPKVDGKLYFDQVMLNIPVDNRYPIPDYFAPFVNPSVNTAANKHWNALLMYDQMLQKAQPHFDFGTAYVDDKGATVELFKRFEFHLGIPSLKKTTDEKVKETLDKFAGLGIVKNDQGIIKGKLMDFPARQRFMKNAQVFNQETQTLLLDSLKMREIGKTLLEAAKLMRSPEITDEQLEALSAPFLLTTQYIFDQGFVRGSGYQIVSHLGYQSREMFDAWFLMRHLLAKHDLLAQAQGAMLWYNAAGRIYQPQETIIDANVDILNTQLQWMVKGILLTNDVAQREQLMAQLSKWLSQTILSSKGVGGGFKADGSIFHHSQHYVAYARDAFGGLAPTVYALSGTDYALDKAAHHRLDDALYKQWVYSKDKEVPVVLSGRHPTGLFKITDHPYRWMALAGEVDNPKQVNQRLAGIFAALSNQESFEGVPAAKEDAGAWAMNYASMAVQRRHGQDPNRSWLAVARGFSRYLVGNEIYQKNNRYGRYVQYGQLELIPSDINQRAFSYDGWNWNRFPGTTVINLPFEKLNAQLSQLPAAGLEEMLLSTETYAGAVDLNNDSLYAVKLHGHSKYGQEDFRANKSFFMFDNRVVAMGTNIQSADQEHSVETTLFQHSVDNDQPIKVNDQPVTQLDGVKVIQDKLVLTDPSGNYYYLPEGQKVAISYGIQKSLDDRNDKPTEGKFATAVIDHGKAPQGDSYEYAIVIEPEKAEQPQYTVLSRSQSLHAVKDKVTGKEGYAFFEAGKLESDGVVTETDKPLMLMTQPQENKLLLAIVNPDLALYQDVDNDQIDSQGKQVEVSIYSRAWRYADSQPQTSQVTVKGQWKLANKSDCASIQVKDTSTVVKTTTTDANICRVELIQ